MTIQEILDNILHAVFGKDVRQSMHDGVKRANDICEETEARQTVLENKYDLLLRNCTELSPSDSEIVDARIKEDGTAYNTLGERLDNLDAKMYKDKESISETFDNLRGMLEQYLPRIDGVSIIHTIPAPGISETKRFSDYCIEDELITPNAKILAAYKNVEVIFDPNIPNTFADVAVDISAIQTYIDIDAHRMYFNTDDSKIEPFLSILRIIYVRDVLET